MICTLAAILLAFSTPLWGASGAISGRVLDAEIGMPVEGASLYIRSLGRNVVSGAEGAFAFGNVPAGSYALEIYRVGFESTVLREVRPGASLEISLSRDQIGLPELVTTASRIEERMESVPEHVTVLSEEELKDVPAHDIGEALMFVPGLTVQRRGGLGSELKAGIQGSIHRHVLVLLDGVPLNTLVEGIVDLAHIPSEHVERVEVIKGATSSVWGSSLGGAINIITKSPTTTGRVSGRIGSWGTRQVQMEGGGVLGPVGCFLTASQARTDGFRPMGDYDGRHAFLKLVSQLPHDIDMSLSFGYDEGDFGGFIITAYGTPFSEPQEHERRYGILSLHTVLAEKVDLGVRLHALSQDIRISTFSPPDAPEPVPDFTRLTDEETKGANVQASVLLSPSHRLVAGVDLNFGMFESQGDHRVNERAMYLSDRIERGHVTLDLGLRLDDNSAFGTVLSPSIGGVYRIRGGTTLLRGTVSRGFNAPPLSFRFVESLRLRRLPNPDIEAERAWVYQLSAETRPVSYVRSKLTVFRAEISDAIEISHADSIEVPGPEGPMMMPMLRPQNVAYRRRQGAELEIQWVTPWGVSGSAGTMFCDVRDFADSAPGFFSLEGGRIVRDRARLTYDVGLDYETPFGVRTNLRGHSVWWNTLPDWGTIDQRFIWDLKISSPSYRIGPVRFEGVASVYNLFDAHFRASVLYPLPERWFEGEIRCTF